VNTPEPPNEDNASTPASFAPADLTDGRNPGDFCSRYQDPQAKREITLEATYLGLLIIAIPCLMIFLWLGYPKDWSGISDSRYTPILKYGFAWLSGALGGTLFDVKWLYHSVAKTKWHEDRRLWRLFIPHLSGGLAFACIALISSRIIPIIDIQSLSSVVGIAFMVGYFSDHAIAKLTEIAENLLGSNRSKPSSSTEKSLPE
jgi:hypothetical protein